MNNIKKFSVLISIYEKENAFFFDQCIKSVFDNSIIPNELILVKDGPLTESLELVIEKYLLLYPEIIKIISLNKNKGLGIALNTGLSYCTNEYVARVDADDINVINRFEIQLDYMLKNPDISVLGGQISEFVETPLKPYGKRHVPLNHDKIVTFMKLRSPFNHMTVMFKKSHVLDSGSYLDFYYMEDYYLWIRMALNGCRFHNLEKTLVYARTGKEMFRRRGGNAYVKSESKLLKFMRKQKLISSIEYYIYFPLKAFIRLINPSLRSFFYKYILR